MAQKILIVDDDKDMVYILTTAFQKEGFEVMTASDGMKGLLVLKKYVPDLMIVDLTMPVMSGWRFTMKIRQEEQFKDTPVIVLSGLLEGDSVPEQFESATAYMVKPFDVFELIAKVKELIKNKA